MRIFAIIPVIIFAMTGCSPTNSSSEPATSTITLGSRQAPGCEVLVSRLEPLIPGAPCSVAITVIPDAGGVEPRAVGAWLAITHESSKAEKPGRAEGSGRWLASLDIPATIPVDTCVWVRLHGSDGSMIEIGRDFPLR